MLASEDAVEARGDGCVRRESVRARKTPFERSRRWSTRVVRRACVWSLSLFRGRWLWSGRLT